jgi:hypothetical protein
VTVSILLDEICEMFFAGPSKEDKK